MTSTVVEPSDRLARRLERFRSARTDPGAPGEPLPHRPIDRRESAGRLAAAVGGEVVETRHGRLVRVEGDSIVLPIDRERLATLPGQPPADRPLVCLDTETTGLATAAGTVAFLIGLGRWEVDRFRQVQLLLPDHPDEPSLLDELAAYIPPDAWLVTYNGRGFDWPLLVTRFRLGRRVPPPHDGHLDLLPVVRRIFRHRMDDARLGTVERMLLGSVRHDDVDGWEIPGRYLGFLRGGPAQPLAAVVRHNHEDVRSLARLLVHIDANLADRATRPFAPRGDLAGLARAFGRHRRLDEAVECLDLALSASAEVESAPASNREEPWWSPRRPADFGGPPAARARASLMADRREAFDRPWDEIRIAVERARLLRRSGRSDEAIEAWEALACGPGRTAIVAAVEVAKLREHVKRDTTAALSATERGLSLAERRRRLGRPEPDLEHDLRHRLRRLRRRTVRRSGQLRAPNGKRGSTDSPPHVARTQA